jgi:DNA polymerase/3'-5' exonuclease PolX
MRSESAASLNLRAAAEQGKISTVKGFGRKTEKKLLEATFLEPRQRNELHIHKALRLAEEITRYLPRKRCEESGNRRRVTALA